MWVLLLVVLLWSKGGAGVEKILHCLWVNISVALLGICCTKLLIISSFSNIANVFFTWRKLVVGFPEAEVIISYEVALILPFRHVSVGKQVESRRQQYISSCVWTNFRCLCYKKTEWLPAKNSKPCSYFLNVVSIIHGVRLWLFGWNKSDRASCS